jgi:hypothetical protein
MLYLANAFSLNMLGETEAVLKVREISIDEVARILKNKLYFGDGFKSVVGHKATAEVLSALLDVRVKFNREAIKIEKRDAVIVFQLLTRLPEGTVLSEEEISRLEFKFYLVVVE